MPETNELRFTLKQHTPIIHFQHDQPEANIRTTEIKPKLDAYIFKEILASHNIPLEGLPPNMKFKESLEAHPIFKKYLISAGQNEHPALDYKIHISLHPNQIHHYEIGKIIPSGYWDLQFPCFFANIGLKPEEKEKQRFFSFSKNPIQVKIFTLNQSLLKYFFTIEPKGGPATKIETILKAFFLDHNFGMRQSKGFGSFTLETFNNQAVDYDWNAHRYIFNVEVPNELVRRNDELKVCGYLTDEDIQMNLKWFKVFDHIDIFYRTLRSGINLPSKNSPFYFKSLMFHWAKKEGEIWDKKRMRQFFYGGGNNRPIHPEYSQVSNRRGGDKSGTFAFMPEGKSSDSQAQFLYRDLLGLSSEQMWFKYDKDTITKEIKSPEGDMLYRFKSPLLFKPVYDGNNEMWRVIISISDIPAQYLAGEATIASKNRGGGLSLRLPQQFDLKEYLAWAINTFSSNPANYFSPHPEHEKMRIIRKIYQDLNSKK